MNEEVVVIIVLVCVFLSVLIFALTLVGWRQWRRSRQRDTFDIKWTWVDRAMKSVRDRQYGWSKRNLYSMYEDSKPNEMYSNLAYTNEDKVQQQVILQTFRDLTRDNSSISAADYFDGQTYTQQPAKDRFYAISGNPTDSDITPGTDEVDWQDDVCVSKVNKPSLEGEQESMYSCAESLREYDDSRLDVTDIETHSLKFSPIPPPDYAHAPIPSGRRVKPSQKHLPPIATPDDDDNIDSNYRSHVEVNLEAFRADASTELKLVGSIPAYDVASQIKAEATSTSSDAAATIANVYEALHSEIADDSTLPETK